MKRLKLALYRWHRARTIRSNARNYPRTSAAVTTGRYTGSSKVRATFHPNEEIQP